MPGAAAHELDHRLDRFGLALEDGLHRPLRRVASPPRDTAALRLAAGRIAEEDPLHATVGDDSAALVRHVGTVDK